MQFLWKWAAFSALNAVLATILVALFEGKMTGNAWGLASLAFIVIILLGFVLEQIWLVMSKPSPTAYAVVAVTTAAVLLAVIIGFAWLLQPLLEMSWQLGLAALLVVGFGAIEAFLAQIGTKKKA